MGSSKNWTIVAFLIGLLAAGGAWYYFFYSNADYEPNEYEINGQTVSSFTYLLQFDSFDSREAATTSMSESNYDLIIMEAYYTTENGGSAWTAAEITQIKSGDAEKLAIAYMSIGEAENYRPYWEDSWDANDDGVPDAGAPSWLDIENPDWEGNYKVKYWDPAWQTLIFGTDTSYFDMILAQGFDGVYMDIVDGFEYYEEKGDEEAGQKMVDFIGALSDYAKAKNPSFLIVPQNGEALADYSGYLEKVDGIGREDVLYNGNNKHPREETDYADEFLADFRAAGKFVLEVEYPTNSYAIDQCYEHAKDQDYLCYVGPRDLDAIQINDGYAPN